MHTTHPTNRPLARALVALLAAATTAAVAPQLAQAKREPAASGAATTPAAPASPLSPVAPAPSAMPSVGQMLAEVEMVAAAVFAGVPEDVAIADAVASPPPEAPPSEVAAFAEGFAAPTAGSRKPANHPSRYTTLAARGALVQAVYNKTLKRNILVDSHGMTLYAFTYDDAGKPACYTDHGYKCVPTWPSCVADPEYDCVAFWPPFETTARPSAGNGVNGAFLNVARRRDGRQQVVYHGHPLYYSSDDRKPGDVLGQRMVSLWWALTPHGIEIR